MKDTNILIQNGVDLNKSLELFGDMEMYDATLNDFLNLVDKKLNSLESYKLTSNMPNYAIEVHSLKSDARYLGFTALADMSYESEMKSKAGDIMFVQENHPKIMAEARKMINVAKKYLGMAVEDETGALQGTPTVAQPTSLVDAMTMAPTIMEPVGPPKDEAILVVDDSSLVANFIKKIFDYKYDVLIANDGQKAIDIVNTPQLSKIKCCLLDLNMPNVDGFQVLEYFKQNNIFVKLPVSIISGVEDMNSLDRVYNYPIVDVLSKPFNERDIQRVIEKSLAAYF